MKQSLIGLTLLISIICGYLYDKKLTRKETIRLMDSLYSAKKKIINYDSIKREIEWSNLKKIDSIGRGEFLYTHGMKMEVQSLQTKVIKMDSTLTRLSQPDEFPK